MAESDLVELVDTHGRASGTAQVSTAHVPPGRLHRAYSVVVVDDAGRLLLQRRAPTKLRFPGLWTNSCCGHPPPGADLLASATLRVAQELGIDLTDAVEVGTFTYRADDHATGFVEHEYDHVVVGRHQGNLRPNPAEVSETAWAVSYTHLTLPTKA